jgi:hypothetical protein
LKFSRSTEQSCSIVFDVNSSHERLGVLKEKPSGVNARSVQNTKGTAEAVPSQNLIDATALVPGRLRIVAIEFRHLDLACQSQLLENPDSPEVEIDLVPGQSMPRAHGMRVVVVMPSLAARQQRNPPAVA